MTDRPVDAPATMRCDALFVSPHFDDAVLACGALIACTPSARVLTLFGGRPVAGTPLTDWDRACGFDEGRDVVAERIAEDRAATAALGATHAWLDEPDAQYRQSLDRAAFARRVADALAAHDPARVFFPLGLFHADHVLASEAVLACIRPACERPAWFVYADALYRTIGHALDDRLAALVGRGFAFAPVDWPADEAAAERKAAAIQCYRSQLRGLSTPGRLGHADALRGETYWRVTRGPEPEPG
jgi:LmbE family N-acetylglucosaminyl deacetylase